MADPSLPPPPTPPPPPPGSQPTNAVERAVVAKGRLSFPAAPTPLILIHPPPAAASVPALAFARHATQLHRHLLGRLRASSRYAGVVLVGLEGDPARMLPSSMEEEGEGEEEGGIGDVVFLDGFQMATGLGIHGGAAIGEEATGQLEFGSSQAFAASVRQAVASATAGVADAAGERRGGDEACCCRALGIDSVNMLAHRLGSAEAALRAIQALLAPPPQQQQEPQQEQEQHPDLLLAPVITVLHPEGMTEEGGDGGIPASVWEDLATTNVYVYPVEGGRGQCLVVRRSASGRVQEEWEPYHVVVDAGGGGGGGGGGVAARVVLGSAAAGGAAGAGAAGSAAPGSSSGDANETSASGKGKGKKKEEAFLESLPFRLSLNDQEQAMRQGVVLPHERRRTANNGEGLPLGYQQEPGQGGYEEDDFEDEEEDDDYDEDEGIDDDLDL